MPIYEYVCEDCLEHFEAMRPMKDSDAPITCCRCESTHTSRQLSLFAAHSEGQVVAGGNTSCSSCASSSCATCGH